MNGGTRRRSVEKVGDSGRQPTMAMAGSSWAERMLSRPARGEGEGRSAVTLAVTQGVGCAVQQAGTKRSVEAAGIEAKGPRGTQGAIKPAGVEHDRWAAEEAMAERVRLAKLGGALGIEQRDEWEGGAMGAQAVVARLRERLRRRIMASWNLTRIGAALGWWNDFLATTRRVPFKALATTYQRPDGQRLQQRDAGPVHRVHEGKWVKGAMEAGSCAQRGLHRLDSGDDPAAAVRPSALRDSPRGGEHMSTGGIQEHAIRRWTFEGKGCEYRI